MTNPYLIEGPAILAFSGGRSSGRMLKECLDAHDGQLPADVHVVFTNTGKEDWRTLLFVNECSSRWSAPIVWLERVDRETFRQVGYNSASRKGEPFTDLIRENGYLPNVANPWCSIALKQRVARQFAASLGWGRYNSIIGLRADERGRVKDARRRTATKKDAWNAVMPLADAGVTQRDVLEWWGEQPFDLGLKGFQGNCDGCFQKAARLFEVERYAPGALDWWIEQEAAVAATARPDARHWILGHSYAEIQNGVRNQPDLFAGLFDNDPDHDAECGIVGCRMEAA